MAAIRIRALETTDVAAVAETMNCPRVVAGTLQLPRRSVEERRERLAQRSPDVHRPVAELEGRAAGARSQSERPRAATMAGADTDRE